MTVVDDIALIKKLKYELLLRCAQDYIIAYRAKLDDEAGKKRIPIWTSFPGAGMKECYNFFEDIFGRDMALVIVRKLREMARKKDPNGKWARTQISVIDDGEE